MNVSLKVIARKDYTFIKRRNMKKNSTVMYVIEFLTVRQREKYIKRLTHLEADLLTLRWWNKYVRNMNLNANPFMQWKFTLESVILIILNAGFVIQNLKI